MRCAEHLWPLVGETVATTPFDTLDQRANKLDRRCAALTDQFTLWRAGEYIQMPLRLETVRRLFPLVTRLTP